jgi:hypothetical protein
LYFGRLPLSAAARSLRTAAAAALLSSTLALSSMAVRAENVVIEHVTLIDGLHAPQGDMTVAVEGQRIATVTPSPSSS